MTGWLQFLLRSLFFVRLLPKNKQSDKDAIHLHKPTVSRMAEKKSGQRRSHSKDCRRLHIKHRLYYISLDSTVAVHVLTCLLRAFRSLQIVVVTIANVFRLILRKLYVSCHQIANNRLPISRVSESAQCITLACYSVKSSRSFFSIITADTPDTAFAMLLLLLLPLLQLPTSITQLKKNNC